MSRTSSSTKPTAAPCAGLPPYSPGKHRPTLVVVLAVILALAAAACTQSNDVATNTGTSSVPGSVKPNLDAAASSSGTAPGTTPGSTPGTAASPNTTQATTAPTTINGPTTTASKSATTTTNGAPSTTLANTPADTAFCDKGKGMQNAVVGLDPAKDPAAYLAKLKGIFAELTAVAPPDVQSDMQTINTIIQSATSLDGIDAVASKTVDEAGKRIDIWAVAHCGYKFGG